MYGGTWCENNLMTFNLGKCKCMFFFGRPKMISSHSLIGSRFEFLNSLKKKKIVMDKKINFINHINVSKA